MGYENSHNGRNSFASQFMRTTVAKLSRSPFITLPYTYNFSDRGAEVNDAITTISSGFDVQSTPGNGCFLLNQYLTDSNGYTPTGVSGYMGRGDTNAFGWNFVFPKDKTLDPTLTGFRTAILAYSGDANERSIRYGLTDFTYNEQIGGETTLSRAFGWMLHDFNPDKVQMYASHGDGVADNTGVVAPSGNGSTNQSANRWYWARFQVDYTANTIRLGIVRAQDSVETNYHQYTMNASGQARSTIPEGIRAVDAQTYSIGYNRIAGFWVGSITDDWPTNTLGSTTEDH